MSLQNPTSKMSKSDPNENGYISILDTPDAIMRKIKRAVTDSGSTIKFEEGRDGINNLISIYSAVTDKTVQQVEAEFDSKGYGDFKLAVAEAVIEHLRPVRERYEDLRKNKDYIEKVYSEGAQKAAYIAQKTLSKVHRRIGYVDRKYVK